MEPTHPAHGRGVGAGPDQHQELGTAVRPQVGCGAGRAWRAADVASGEGPCRRREDDEDGRCPASSSLRARPCRPSLQPDQPATAWLGRRTRSRPAGGPATTHPAPPRMASIEAAYSSWLCCVRLLGPRPVPSLRRLAGPLGRARAADGRAASASPVCSVVRDRHFAMLTRNSPQRARPPVADDHGRAGLMRPSTGSRSCDRRAARAPFMRGEEGGDETNERPPGVDPDEVPGRRFVPQVAPSAFARFYSACSCGHLQRLT